MMFGVDYYPEQWDVKLIDSDMKSFKNLGLNLIRIAEFAWHVFEPEEGKFSFEFFDYVVSKAKECKLKIIFGTPTATMPAWLALKYPETLSENEYGYKRAFGGRRQYCFNSANYTRLSKRIVEKIVSHYSGESQMAV